MADRRARQEAVENREAVERAWAVVIERRARRVLAGRSEGVPWEEVREKIKSRLSRSSTRNDHTAEP